MLEPDVARVLLAKAVAGLGAEKVAQQLRTSPESVRAWVDGHANMPERKYAEILDLMDLLGP